ncbi:hypothetical protein [Paenibacillus spongiae]|uniref:Uncharacterized protein n=1 Tax=Paenibacillus spongiae TaxID=2909671 RepID=A0ABY5S4C4_9BACL|nr:hypothetical protein [Paenibacillus spongiae]UVI28529.1 hypothetical protein L1F29_24210 [Paenibacillus spongiae]
MNGSASVVCFTPVPKESRHQLSVTEGRSGSQYDKRLHSSTLNRAAVDMQSADRRQAVIAPRIWST